MEKTARPTQLGRFVREASEPVAINRPESAAVYFLKHIYTPFEAFEQEEMWLLLLNARSQVTHEVMLYRGTLTTIQVRAAEIFREAIRMNASSFILAHNHPSGVAEPSRDDEQMTARVKQAAELMDILFYDHLILGRHDWTSLRERGGW